MQFIIIVSILDKARETLIDVPAAIVSQQLLIQWMLPWVSTKTLHCNFDRSPSSFRVRSSYLEVTRSMVARIWDMNRFFEMSKILWNFQLLEKSNKNKTVKSACVVICWVAGTRRFSNLARSMKGGFSLKLSFLWISEAFNPFPIGGGRDQKAHNTRTSGVRGILIWWKNHLSRSHCVHRRVVWVRR